MRERGEDTCGSGGVIVENFISGGSRKVNRILNSFSNVTKNNFIDVNDINFEDFGLRAYDKDGQYRALDTEIKYAFNFLENHYALGDHFVINTESTLYTCKSCQRYLQALKAMAIADCKTIEITFKAHPQAIQMDDAELLIQQNGN